MSDYVITDNGSMWACDSSTNVVDVDAPPSGAKAHVLKAAGSDGSDWVIADVTSDDWTIEVPMKCTDGSTLYWSEKYNAYLCTSTEQRPEKENIVDWNTYVEWSEIASWMTLLCFSFLCFAACIARAWTMTRNGDAHTLDRDWTWPTMIVFVILFGITTACVTIGYPILRIPVMVMWMTLALAFVGGVLYYPVKKMLRKEV